MKVKFRKVLLALLALTLVAAACTSSSDNTTDTTTDNTTAPADDDGDDGGDDSSTETTAPVDEDDGDDGEDTGDSEGVKLGIMGECEGAFGGFHEDVVSGATLAMVERAGATVNSSTTSLEGFTGASIAGTDIELVGIGCGDDTADRAIQEIRTLVEQNGANVILGPLSGDEGIAIANYALDHPEVTFINGISGAQDATLAIQAPNFFRYNGDGAQWNAGIGDVLYREGGWETAAVIADDYGFGWTSAAGFVADFCAAGGAIEASVFPPLGTTDYSSFVQQLPDPDEVDGYFWVIGGTGTNASLEAFLNAKGDLVGDQHAGNLFFSPALAEALGPDIAGAWVGGFASLPGDITTPEITAYLASADSTWDTLATAMSGGEPGAPSASMSFGFAYGFYTAGIAFATALEAVDGDLSNNHEALRAELSSQTLDLPFGSISLDDNRQGIVDTFVAQLTLQDDGTVGQSTRYIVPGVDQTFGGTWSEDTDPPERDNTPCEPRDLPWQGNEIPVVDGVPQN